VLTDTSTSSGPSCDMPMPIWKPPVPPMVKRLEGPYRTPTSPPRASRRSPAGPALGLADRPDVGDAEGQRPVERAAEQGAADGDAGRADLVDGELAVDELADVNLMPVTEPVT